MRRLLLILTVLLASTIFTLARAQEAPPPTAATPLQDINLRQGPGTTYPGITRLYTTATVNIVERNSIGTWVRVQQMRPDGSVGLDGWVVSGYLNLNPELRFSTIPVSPLVDAIPERAESLSLRPLYAAPVISVINPAMRDVYQRGLEMRHYTHVITKIGDSVSADSLYLNVMSRPSANLGPYDYLSDALHYFAASTQQGSVAARVGLNTFAVFDPTWAPSDQCEPNETPLHCELRLKRPSIALIMFGGNDVKNFNLAEYEQQMRRIVEETLAQGVIPVLSTFSADPNFDTWADSISFNTRIIQIATDYQVPLINLWLAARSLPEFGLEGDGIHMNHWGTDTLRFDSGFPAFSGANLRNLLALRMVDEIRRTIFIDPNALG